MSHVLVAHPGEMGTSVARAAAQNTRVLWVSQGRSAATRTRAEAAGLVEVGTLGDALAQTDILYAVCPPDRAEALAEEVAGHAFGGLYVDCNAISPETASRVGECVEGRGARFVDGGIIGPPATRAGTTRLYLSGPAAAAAAAPFADSALEAVVMHAPVGAASALKSAYAAWTKGSAALLLNVCALAEANGVDAQLRSEWALSQPGLEARAEAAARGSAFKAWRFEGEMRQIAAAFAAAGLSDAFHDGAADVYSRLAGFKGRGADVPLDAVIDALLATRRER